MKLDENTKLPITPAPLRVEEIDIEILKKYIHPTYVDCDRSNSTIDTTRGLEATYIGVLVYDEVTEEKIKIFCDNINKLYSKGLIENVVLAMPLTMKLALIGDRERWVILFYPMTKYHITYLKRFNNLFQQEGGIPVDIDKVKIIK